MKATTTATTAARQTKKERVIAKLKADKKLARRMDHDDYNHIYVTMEQYLKALREGRLIAVVKSVSQSGMTRKINFVASCKPKGATSFQTYSFSYHMNLLLGSGWGFKDNALVVKGCGMDMVFHTNDCMIRTLQRYGFVTKKQADNLVSERITCI